MKDWVISTTVVLADGTIVKLAIGQENLPLVMISLV